MENKNTFKVKIEAKPKGPATEPVNFSMGNPSVEHITGILHLYKSTEEGNAAEEHDTTTVCVLAVPADMGIAEFCEFLGSYMPLITTMRMVRRDNAAKCSCMAAIDFKDTQTAREFVNEYNGRPFSSLEPDIICRAVYTTSVEIHEPSASQLAAAAAVAAAASSATSDSEAANSLAEKLHLQAPEGHVELPTCPVCLERLDEHVSGIFTTVRCYRLSAHKLHDSLVQVCNHRFHSECLQKWGDSSCPVCRYSINAQHDSNCQVCDASVDLWMCLLCGHVGCGRYRSAHARDHYTATDHCYSLEVNTGRVWDYVGDGYVHRLIQSQVDGKLVELPSPGGHRGSGRHSGRRSNAAPAGGSDKGSGDAGERGAACNMAAQYSSAGEDDRAAQDDVNMLEASYASKMDAVTLEYTHLLTSQLESQRHYFEDLRARDMATHEAELDSMRTEVTHASAQATKLQQRVHEAEGQTQHAHKAAKKEFDAKVNELQKDHDVLSELNKSLITNQKAWQEKVKGLELANSEKDTTIKDLQDQVHDLMMFIEGSKMAQQNDDLAGGSAQAGEQKQLGRRRQKR